LLFVTDAPEEQPADPRDALIRQQAEEIAALRALVADLREQLETLAREKSRNSGNSSLPPSSDDAVPGRGQPSRQKRGKQPGSPGTSMTWEVPDRIVDYYPQGACSCGTGLEDAADLGVARSFQQEEVPAQVSERVQHDLHHVKCAGCGKEHAAPRPDGVPAAALSAGPRLRALAVYLVVHQHVPVERCRQLLSDVTGADVSAGLVHSCLRKASSLAAGTVALIRKLIAASPVAGFDETTLRAGPAGVKKYVHGAFTGRYSAFWLGTRGLDTMEDAGILPDFAGIAVTDRYKNYWNARWEHVLGHQACCAHLLRDFEDCAESHPGAVWPVQAQRALRGMIRAWHDAVDQGLSSVPADVLKPLEHEFRHAVLAGLASVPRVPGPKNQVRQKPGRELLEFCRNRRDDVLRFTKDTSVWPTNEGASYCTSWVRSAVSRFLRWSARCVNSMAWGTGSLGQWAAEAGVVAAS
jgi:hypothetical protein